VVEHERSDADVTVAIAASSPIGDQPVDSVATLARACSIASEAETRGWSSRLRITPA